MELLLILLASFAIFRLALSALYWIFSANSVGQGFGRLFAFSAACFMLFWLKIGILAGLGLEKDAKERQRTTGESFFGG